MEKSGSVRGWEIRWKKLILHIVNFRGIYCVYKVRKRESANGFPVKMQI